MRLAAVTPSTLPMRTSINTTAGRRRSASTTAASPSLASPTTRMFGSRESAMRRPSRTISWSSAMRQVIGWSAFSVTIQVPPRAGVAALSPLPVSAAGAKALVLIHPAAQINHAELIAKGLADRAPMHDPRLVALPAPEHGRAAAAAAASAVHRLVERPVCPHARLQRASRLLEQRAQRLVRDATERRPRVDAQGVQGLAAHDVADTRRDGLIQQHLADRPRGVGARTRALHGDIDARILVEQIRAEAPQRGVEGDARAVEQLQHPACLLYT